MLVQNESVNRRGHGRFNPPVANLESAANPERDEWDG